MRAVPTRPTNEPGLHLPMSDPQTTVEDPDASLQASADVVRARFPAKGAEKLAAQQAADVVAVAYQAVQQPSDGLTFAIVRLMRSAGRYESALTLLRERQPRPAGMDRHVLFQEMELCLFTGRTEDGEQLLARLEAGGPLRPSWLRSVERIRAKKEKAAAAAAASAQPGGTQAQTAQVEDDPCQALIDRVLAVIARFPVKEAQKYSVRAAAEQVLADYRAEAKPSHELTYAVLRMLRVLKRYPAALELMAQRRPFIEGKAAEIDFLEIELHLRARQREAGEALLTKFLEAGHVLRPRWKRALAKIARKYDALGVRSALEELQQALCELRADVDVDVHLPLLKPAMPAPNQALEVLMFIDGRIRALRRIVPGGPVDLGAFEKYHCAKLIFTCGFSWSGSGAVSCFLAQHKQVTLPFGSSEMAYLQGRDGRKGIFPFLAQGAMQAQAMRVLLATFFMESIVAATRPHYSFMAKCLAAEHSRIGALGELIDDFHAAMLSADALRDAAVRRQIMALFLQRLFSVLGGTHVLLNNVFLGPRTVMLGAMQDALFVVVERDARDQYVARKIESGHAGEDGVEKFAAMLQQGRAKFEAILHAAEPTQLEQQLFLVRFEDFLRDNALRRTLLERLELPADGIVPNRLKFDPSVSLGNVGIHAAGLTEQEREYIEREVGLYLRKAEAP